MVLIEVLGLGEDRLHSDFVNCGFGTSIVFDILDHVWDALFEKPEVDNGL